MDRVIGAEQFEASEPKMEYSSHREDIEKLASVVKTLENDPVKNASIIVEINTTIAELKKNEQKLAALLMDYCPEENH